MKNFIIIPLVWLLVACTGAYPVQQTPLNATRQLLDSVGTTAGIDDFIRLLYESRTWVPDDALVEDPV